VIEDDMDSRWKANIWQLCRALDRAKHGGRIHLQSGAIDECSVAEVHCLVFACAKWAA
jgi:hypothetical protein